MWYELTSKISFSDKNLTLLTRLNVFGHTAISTLTKILIILNWTFELCITAIIAPSRNNVWLIFVFINNGCIKSTVIVFSLFLFWQVNHLHINDRRIVAYIYDERCRKISLFIELNRWREGGMRVINLNILKNEDCLETDSKNLLKQL